MPKNAVIDLANSLWSTSSITLALFSVSSFFTLTTSCCGGGAGGGSGPGAGSNGNSANQYFGAFGGVCGAGGSNEYCRPKVKVSSKTPKTISEISTSKLASKKAEKSRVGMGNRVSKV